MSGWIWMSGGVLLLIAAVLMIVLPDDEARVSSRWIADQARRRGVTGFEGAYRAVGDR